MTSASPAHQTNASTTADRPRRPIRPRDLHRLRAVGEVALRPDGSAAVYTVTWPDAETDSNRSVLHGLDLVAASQGAGGGSTGGPRQLTDGHADVSPTFAPDGGRVAFIRRRPKQPTQVMVMDWPSGSAVVLAEFEDGVAGVRWATTDRLVVSAPTRPADQQDVDNDELARRPKILTRLAYRFDGRGQVADRPVGLRLLSGIEAACDPGDEEAKVTVDPIGPAGIDHGPFALSPDGSSVVAVATSDDDADLTGTNHLWLYRLDDPAGEAVCLTDRGGSWAGVMWHPDGTLLACGSVRNDVATFARPHRVAVPGQGDDPTSHQPSVEIMGGSDRNVAALFVSGIALAPLGGPAAPQVPSGFLAVGTDRGRMVIDHYELSENLDGPVTAFHHRDEQVRAMAASPDGSTVVAAITSSNRPAELWLAGPEPKKLVALNDAVLADIDLATTETTTVVSADGTEVEAFVITPPASAPAKGPNGRPGLLYIHGGPMSQYGHDFFDEFQMAAACGYVVMAANPRGSDGYGEAWAQAPLGDLGNLDWADVRATADALAARDDVDENRLGVGGGSYGGFMTGWALSHDDRFKAGLVERAVTSWSSFTGTSDIGTWFTPRTIGADVDTNPAEVDRQSPLTHAAAITVPTLIVHSEEDWRCPIEQGEQLFAALRRHGVDVTMVRFPGESHGLTRGGGPRHRVERFEIVHEFFARHLGGADFGTDHLRYTDEPS